MSSLSRRRLLRGLAGGLGLLTPLSRMEVELSAALASLHEPGGRDESYWQLVRSQFSFPEDRVPMNAANLCPSPRAVAERVTELTRDIDFDCSFQNRAKFQELLEEARRKIADHLGTGSDEIALVRNTTEGNNIISNGFPLGQADEVLLWDQNHPTNNVVWDVRAARFGFSVRRVSTPRRPASSGELADVFTRAFTPATRLLALTHVSNTSGLRLPVREICQEARRRGIYVHVDGAQTWGALDVDLKEMGCDSYAASSHKWFMGPKEAGVLYVRGERIEDIWPGSVGAGWGRTVESSLQGALKFESLGQRDDACLAALATAADFHRLIGPSRIERRILQQAGRLKAGLLELGLRLVTPEEPSLSAGVVVVEVSAVGRAEVFEQLYRKYGIGGAATGGLRLCPHVYNTREHLARAVEAVRSVRPLLA